MPVLQQLSRVLRFAAVCGALYVGALGVASHTRYRDREVLCYLSQNLQEPGDWTYSLPRFREADELATTLREGGQRLDIVFFGSSHGYRGFDPRIFEAQGWSAFNLSSTVQTPLNAYFLQKRYLPSFKPRLVIVEIYYHTLHSDGLESYRNLVVNMSPSVEQVEMAAATHHVGAVNFAVAKQLGWIADEASAKQVEVQDESYVSGGYAERTSTRAHESHGTEIDVTIRPEQLEYLMAAATFARDAGAKVVWVTHPLPRDHLRRVPNYRAMRSQVEAAARIAQVPYWDFNGELSLDPLNDFFDFSHLNASGVGKFNRALITKLREEHLLDKWEAP